MTQDAESVVYLVAFADCLSGFDTHEAIDRAYLTKEEAEAEVERVANAIKASGEIGVHQQGLTIIELPLGGQVSVHKGSYLAPFINAALNDGPGGGM